jgi:hypothetical protein
VKDLLDFCTMHPVPVLAAAVFGGLLALGVLDLVKTIVVKAMEHPHNRH